MTTMRFACVLLLAVLCFDIASACSIPVFRYALERWAPAAYELLVFHRGPLTPEQQALVRSIPTSEGETNANVTVLPVDLAADPAPALVEIWKRQKLDQLPAIILRTPRGSEVESTVWAGPLSSAAIRLVFHSPARSRIVERLLKGDSAVWLLLESGNRQDDDAAAELLARRVEHMQKTLKLSEIDPDDVVKHKISVGPEDLKVAFSVIRVSRTDPAEEVLVRMLLASEDDLHDASEPMAFPVFGRGRALFALVGKGIVNETIAEACSFVIGPCSCVVKELNPGHDLLITAAWGSLSKADSHLEAELAGLQSKPGTLVPIAPGSTAQPVPNPTAAVSRPAVKWGFVAVIGVVLMLATVGALFLLGKRR